MEKIKKTIILILAICSFVGAHSQSKAPIRGKLIDQKDKSPIIGATIVETDKDNRVVDGTISDIDGNFVYQMKNSANTMKASVIGYQTKTFTPDFLKAVVIELVSSDIELDQVMITAKAKSSNSLTNIDDRDNSSSRVKIDLLEMKDEGITSAADALQGKISGLDIIAASGDPGSGSQIVIRGLSSIGNNKPLIVIDGIPQDKVSSSFDLSSANSEDISNMINIALQDIKSIEVLKDAASTAIYGSKGADGVLLIETQRGKMGKVQFDYQYKSSLNFQPPAIPMLNGDEYIMLQLEEWHNSKGVFNIPAEISYNKDFIDFYNYSANTDWLGEITKNAVTNDHYFKISGGGEKTRYFTSLSHVDESGTTINTGAKRFSARVNLDYFLSKKLMFTVQFSYTKNNIENNLAINGRNIRQMAYIKAPNMSIWEYDAKGKLTGEYFNPINSYQGNGTTYFNPVAVANLSKNSRNENALENSFRLRYTIKDWLVFRETVSFQFNGTQENTYLPYNAIGSDWLDPKVNFAGEGNNASSSIKTESQLSFDIPLANKDHVLSGAATWVTNEWKSKWMYTEGNRTPSIDIQDPGVGGQINTIGSGSRQNRDLGALFNGNYKFKDRYMLQTIMRADANSAFGSSNRWGLFKGVSLGWRFSDEEFLSSYDNWMNDCLLRASWGVSGRPPSDPYARFATYETTSTGSYLTNPAIIQSRIQLDNLKWESIASSNLGLELNLFNDRFFLEGEIYRKQTTDLLFTNYNIPLTSGFNQLRFLNGGELENKGWEMMMNVKIIRKKDFQVSLDFNTSQNINTFTELPENFNTEKSTAIGNGEYPLRLVKGEPIGSFFGFRYLGVYASDEDVIARDADGNLFYDSKNRPIPMTYKDTYLFKGGDAKYEDINHDGKIDLNDVVFIGDSNPDFIGGFGSALKYKNFDLSFSFYYRIGFDIINMIALQTQGMNGRNNQSKKVLSRWRIQGQNEAGMLPRAYLDHPANNLGSDRYVERGDFLRLNNVKFGYRLKQSLCNKMNLQSVNLSVSARKLFTVTNYSGQDPEVGQNAADPFWIGADYANTPPPKMVTISLAVGL
ncbi:MAG TPA: SusC/RagA family TonB-linked outer membrane protein [Prolixibacteraceae bacterium]|nr:SusC/RagA family TonB-linked outer membrane protein [Prolixibacteraceae bacterium]